MLESLQLFALGGRQARTLPGITLRLADPSAERFDPAAQFLGDRSNRGPLRRMLGGVVEDHPDCTLTQLRGVLTGASHGLHPLSEWALRQTRYDSALEAHRMSQRGGVNPSVETIRLAHLQRSSLLPSFIREKDDRCGGCGKLRFVQFSKSLVGAFCASTGTAASTPSFVARNCPITWHRENRL